MTIDLDVVHELRREYEQSSWAVWSEKFPRRGCLEEETDDLVEFVESHRSILKPGIVFLGLSRSTKETDDFENFHSTSLKHGDFLLKLVVEEAGFEGAYMTDISKDIEANSKKVDITNEKDRGDALELKNQFDILGKSHFDVICFGRDAFYGMQKILGGNKEILDENVWKFSTMLGEFELDVYSVYHYTLHAGKGEDLREQLTYLKRNFIEV